MTWEQVLGQWLGTLLGVVVGVPIALRIMRWQQERAEKARQVELALMAVHHGPIGPSGATGPTGYSGPVMTGCSGTTVHPTIACQKCGAKQLDPGTRFMSCVRCLARQKIRD